jgi:hypothetical protein
MFRLVWSAGNDFISATGLIQDLDQLIQEDINLVLIMSWGRGFYL